MNNNIKVPVEVYSRVVGYYRPVEQWNEGKKSEFSDRRSFDLSNFKDNFLEFNNGAA